MWYYFAYIAYNWLIKMQRLASPKSDTQSIITRTRTRTPFLFQQPCQCSKRRLRIGAIISLGIALLGYENFFCNTTDPTIKALGPTIGIVFGLLAFILLARSCTSSPVGESNEIKPFIGSPKSPAPSFRGSRSWP